MNDMTSPLHVRATIDALIEAGDEVGVQVVTYLGQQKVLDVAMGTTAPGGAEPVTPETLFSIYSVVKGVTATAAHVLADRGLLDLDAPIASYWPEFSQNGKAEITLRDVLTHRAGLPHMPAGVTPERMSDWQWMTREIAGLTPMPLGQSRTAYQALTFGWLVGETVRRADPTHRPISRFVQEEICEPLGITDLYLALPEAKLPLYAVHTHVPDPPAPPDSLNAKAMPPQVRLTPDIFSRPDVLGAEVPAVNGIANARSVARFFAMLANEGELDGVRILSRQRVRGLLTPVAPAEEFEPVLMRPWRLSTGGFFLASSHKPAAGSGAELLFGMGMGGSLAFADLGTGISVAITHNRMLNARSPDADPIRKIADAVRADLDIN